jgi:DNA-dependent metalloprotease WSS1
MVHVRLNERETNPNSHVNFISALGADREEEARQLIRALAAQVKPVMKTHGFTVNSLEEVSQETTQISSTAASPLRSV